MTQVQLEFYGHLKKLLVGRQSHPDMSLYHPTEVVEK